MSDTLTASGIFSPLKKHFAALDSFLEVQINEFAPAAREMVRYTFMHRGKRLRPALVFFSGWVDENTVSQDLVCAAAAVELIHLATLVHDDILDDAKIRHSSPTLFAKYGSHTAVLLGDAIFAHALKLMSDFNSIEACRAMAVATREVCNGEIWQTSERGNAHLSLDDYFRIIQMKTGGLFEISAFVGTVLSGGGTGKAKAFAEFGRRIGRAYQIFDDVVDYLGDEATIGKTLGTDFSSGKFTLPEILFLQKLDPREREKFIAENSSGHVDFPAIVKKMRAAGTFEESRKYFLIETQAAKKAVSDFSETAGVAHLLALSDFVATQISRIA